MKEGWKVYLQIPFTKKMNLAINTFGVNHEPSFFTGSNLNSMEAIETQSWKSWNDLPFAVSAPAEVMAIC